MQQLYPLLFLCLAAGCAYLEWPRGKDAQKAAKPAAFLAFRNNYLFVYSCMMGARALTFQAPGGVQLF